MTTVDSQIILDHYEATLQQTSNSFWIVIAVILSFLGLAVIIIVLSARSWMKHPMRNLATTAAFDFLITPPILPTVTIAQPL